MTQLLRTHMQDNELVSNRLGARTCALNLGQLPGCPTHWDLNEIPVIAAGFSILSRNARLNAPAGAVNAEPA